MKEKRIFKDPAQLAQAFTDFLLEEIGGQSDYHLALSGGSTPKALFQMWSAEHASKKEWHNVHFYWGD
ncbi:MAG: 6-phosphogluconolactonase, partial [Bacteroidota bacterium]